jgi:hypothetical protein
MRAAVMTAEGPRIRVLSPVGEARREALASPPLPRDLRGKTVGFLDNTKANFDRLVSDMAGLLKERFGVVAVLHRKKANAATPAPPDMLADLAKACDLVFAGSGD